MPFKLNILCVYFSHQLYPILFVLKLIEMIELYKAEVPLTPVFLAAGLATDARSTGARAPVSEALVLGAPVLEPFSTGARNTSARSTSARAPVLEPFSTGAR